MTANQLALVLTRWASVLLLAWGFYVFVSELAMFTMMRNAGGNTGSWGAVLGDPLFVVAPGVPLLFGVCGLIFARRVARLLSRGCHPAGHCQRCGYLPPPGAAKCPECGCGRVPEPAHGVAPASGGTLAP